MATIKGRTVATFFGVIGFSVVAMVGAVQYSRLREKAELSRAFANAKAAGLGIDVSYFRSDLPDAENAWITLKPIATSVSNPELKSTTRGVLNPEDLAANRAEVAKIRPSLQPVQDIQLKHWNLKLTTRQVVTFDSPARILLVCASKTFASSSYIRALDGDWKGAENELKTAAKVQSFALSDPTWCDAWKIFRENSNIRRTIAAELAATKNPTKIQHLADQVLPLLPPPDPEKTLASSCAFALSFLNALQMGDLDLEDTLVSSTDAGLGDRLPPNYHRLKVDALRYFTDFANAAKAHHGDPIAMSKAASAVTSPTYPEFAGNSVVGGLIMPAEGSLYLNPLLDKTESLLLCTGLQLEVYKERHGHYPARLDDLQPIPEPDPLTKKPLNYRLEGKGFVLWSTGEDLTDQGAVMKNNYPDDLIFQTADPTRPFLLGR